MRAGTRTTAPNGAPNGANIAFTVPQAGDEIVFSYNSTTHVLTVSRPASAARVTSAGLGRYWVTADTHRLEPEAERSPLDDVSASHYDADGGLTPRRDTGVTGRHRDPADLRPGGPVRRASRRSSRTSRATRRFKVPADRARRGGRGPQGPDRRVRRQGRGGKLRGRHRPCRSRACSTTSTPTTAPLGADLRRGGVPTLRVWAPTARTVKLHLFADSNPATAVRRPSPMTRDAGHRRLERHRHRDAGRQVLPLRGGGLRPHRRGKVETNLRHRSLLGEPVDATAQRSQIVDLADAGAQAARAGTHAAQAARWRRPRTSSSTSCTCATSASTTPTVPADRSAAPSWRSPIATPTA